MVPQWLVEDGYRQLDPSELPWAGDVVIYKDGSNSITHLALVLEAPADALGIAAGPLVMSKWGSYGEYVHRLLDVESVLGNSVEYWTERQ